MQEIDRFYLSKDQDQKEGPYSFDQLKEKYEKGEILDTTDVWTEKFGQWIPYKDLLKRELYYRDTPLVPPAESQVSFEPQELKAKERSGRPWVRFWARMLDYALFFAIASAVAIIFNIYPEESPKTLTIMVTTFIWVWIEGFLLATWGYTPGKWLLKIKVRRIADRKKLSFRSSLERSLSVWFVGLGAGIPLAALITMIVANVKLSNLGVATWDKRGNYTVIHEHIGILRTLITIVFFLAISILVLAEFKHVL